MAKVAQINPKTFIKKSMESGFAGIKQDTFEILITFTKYSDVASLPDRKIGLLLKEEALQGWMDKDDEH